MDYQWRAYAQGKRVAVSYLKAQGLAPLHPANAEQFRADPWPLSALAVHTHGKAFAEQLKSLED